jgi:hypothetical protein
MYWYRLQIKWDSYKKKKKAVVRYSQAEGVSQSESHRGLWEITVKKFPAERQCLCGATNLKMAERH